MAAANNPISVKEVFSLRSVAINLQFIMSEHVTMQSDKYICVRGTKPQDSTVIIVIIDMSMPNQPMRTRSFTAEFAIVNPDSKILALRSYWKGYLQIFKMENYTLMKSHEFDDFGEQIVFWKWITPKMLSLVTQTSVYHWSIEGHSKPVKVFRRTSDLKNNQIIDYHCDPSEKWLVLIGIVPPERPKLFEGFLKKKKKLFKGNMQLFSVNQPSSECLEAHAACFAQYKVPGNETPSILLSYATKTIKAGQITSKLHVIELGGPPGKPSFGNKQADMFYPPDFADDFPVAMHMSHKYSMIYVITKLGLLFIYDLETVTAVYRSRISADPIFLTTEASSVGGFYAVNERGQVLLASYSEQSSGALEEPGNAKDSSKATPPTPTSLHSDEPKSTNSDVAANGHSVDTTNEPENESEDELEASVSVSSDEPAPLQKYDVFLSFRGEDTRKGFLSHLYHELQNTRVIKTFKDDQQLQKGMVISSNLLKAIEESRFAIIVMSQNYASSTWCLDELAKIYQCMKDKDTILPIFYYVDPSDVRHQRKSFKEAFTMHQKTADNKKLNQWRAALKGVAGIVGWDIKDFSTERELVEDIVKYVWSKVLKEPTGDFETFGATKQAMDEVMKALKDDQVTIIGVHGMRGAGKTTMVKHVGAQAQNNGLFDYVVMVAVSQKPDFQKIQVSLANFLGLKLEEETNIGRASRLKERILRENKILIILDDIWEGIALESIGLPDYEELRRCKSKVIFTTRMSNVCDSMQCHAQIHLDVLSEEDSWKFLMEKSFLKSTDSGNEARKLARRCDGLPNALKAAVRALGDKNLEEWNEAVARAFGDSYLEKWNEESQLVNFRADRDVFHSLASEAKSCLLLCCLFPEDYDIPIEDILKYGIGKGLFRCDTIQEARDRAYSVVKYLKASRLLLDGSKKGCVRMHNEMRDVSMSVALSEEGHGILLKAGCELKDWPEDAHRGYSAISLMRNKLRKLPENLVCAELQILLLQCNVGICEISDTFFRSPNTLRVFDLSFTSIAILPSSFSFLSNLQTLNLDYCSKLIDISILGRLSKLEILSMRKSPLKKFPEEIGDLTNLRMLDVTGGCVETVPSNVLSRLYRLEELHMKVEFGDWGSKIKEAVEETNAEFDELTGLSYLNILKVYISDAACLPKNVEEFKPNWVEYDICISKDVPWDMVLNDHPSRTLTLDTTIKSLPDWFINVVTEKAENLEYINCKDLSNILVEYNQGRLHRLKHLSVNGRHKNLEELMNALTWVPDKPVFENLEKLHLLYLHSLKQLCVGELPPGSLRSLKLLKVQTCRSLENALLPSKLLKRLRNLEKCICVNMEVMKYVFSFEGLDPEKILLTKLKEMRLCCLFELVSIWNGPAPHAIFHNLQVLAVCECKKLKNLFTFDVAECLFQLEDLCIELCPNMDRVIDASENLNRKIVFPALKNLALRNLPELTSFCTIGSGTIEMDCPSLENLYVAKCPQFPHSAHHFGSNSHVHFNDQQHLSSLVKRWEEMHIQI